MKIQPNTESPRCIGISNISVKTRIGISEEEQRKARNLFVSLKLYYDFQSASQSDQLEQTIDYATVASNVSILVEELRVQLIETVASQVARMILTKYPVEGVTVRIDKPGAVLRADNVYVELTMKRNDLSAT